ncbi:hypothetical protein [Streptomyces sp. NPDC002845]
MNLTVARALVDLVVSIEMSDGEAISIDASTSLIEDVVVALGGLSGPEREEFIAVINQMESEAHTGERRQILQDLPEGLGISD